MPSLLRSVAALAATMLPVACYKIEARTTVRSAVPAQLQGEWTGSWTDGANDQNGTLQILLRTFQNQLVLGFSSDHPAAQQALVWHFQGTQVRLTGDGIEFTGTLDTAARTFSGTFTGSEGAGSWQAEWQRELPPIVDVSGTWVGSFASSSEPNGSGPLQLQLEQLLIDGQLRLRGSIELPSLQLTVPVVDGYVDWLADTFDLQMISDISELPIVQLTGIGDPEGPSVERGEFIVLPPPGLPVGLGSWQAVWVGR